MSWLHCNTCFFMVEKLASDAHELHGKMRKFFLSQCGRVHCEECVVATGDQKACPKCGCATIRINDDAPKDIRPLFEDPFRGLKQMAKISVFQGLQRKSKLNHLLRELKASKELAAAKKLELQQLEAKLKSAKDEEQRLAQRKARLEKTLSKPRKSTPQARPLSSTRWDEDDLAGLSQVVISPTYRVLQQQPPLPTPRVSRTPVSPPGAGADDFQTSKSPRNGPFLELRTPAVWYSNGLGPVDAGQRRNR